MDAKYHITPKICNLIRTNNLRLARIKGTNKDLLIYPYMGLIPTWGCSIIIYLN